MLEIKKSMGEMTESYNEKLLEIEKKNIKNKIT